MNAVEKSCTCTKCKTKGTAKVFHLIEEDHIEEVRNLSLFQWKCPKCGHVLKLLYPCTYVDREGKFAVYYTDGKKEACNIGNLDGFTKRVCDTIDEFSEKVRMLDDGIEDRAMELLKIVTFASFHMQDDTLEQIFYYRKNEMSQYEFTIFTANGADGIAVQASSLEPIQELVAQMPPLGDMFHRIDLDWAGSTIVEYQ